MTIHKTKLAEQLSTLVTPGMELYMLACTALRGSTLEEATATLRAWVTARPNLVEVLARHYLETRILPDMRGDALSSTREADYPLPSGLSAAASSRGPFESDGANVDVPSGLPKRAPPLSPTEDGEGHFSYAAANKRLPSPSSPLPDERGHRTRADGHHTPAPPVRKPPNPPRGIDAIASVQRDEDRKLFDTFKVRGGKAIGDLTVFDARKIADTNEREARILRTLCSHVAGYTPGGTKLRDAVKPALLRKALAQNVKAPDLV